VDIRLLASESATSTCPARSTQRPIKDGGGVPRQEAGFYKISTAGRRRDSMFAANLADPEESAITRAPSSP